MKNNNITLTTTVAIILLMTISCRSTKQMSSTQKTISSSLTQTIKATMLEFATPVLKRYAAFTAWVNPNYTENDYSEIYARSYLYYFDNVPALMHEFSFDGADWKQGFEGTLFIK